MKKLVLLVVLLFPILAFSQDVKNVFLTIPINYLEVSAENRSKIITETKNDLLKFRLSEAKYGEVKIISQKKDEILVGMTTNNCDGNTLQFLKVKNGNWKDVTKDIIKPLGKDDLINILRVSPVSISKLDQELGIAMFYEFSEDLNALKLIARKQDSCDVAGTVYNYKFNGKKFEIVK
jgi:hypothetical protein